MRAKCNMGAKWLSQCTALVVFLFALGLPGRAQSVVTPPTGNSPLQTAEQQFHQGNYAAAIGTLRAIVSQGDPSAAVYYWLARSYYESRDYDNAVAQAEKSVALEPTSSLYHQWLGRAYGEAADRDHSFFMARKVKKQFQQAVRLDPSNISARRDLEEYCIEAPWIVGGSKQEALAQVKAIAALNPVDGYLARAVYALKELKQPREAAAEYRKVLSAKPDSVEPYIEVADFFVNQSNPSTARDAVQAAAVVAPDDPRLAFYRGVVDILAHSRTTEAEQDLKSYLASTPDRSDWPSHAVARIWLGRLYEAQGKPGDAAEQYRAALRLNPSLRDARAQLERLEQASR